MRRAELLEKIEPCVGLKSGFESEHLLPTWQIVYRSLPDHQIMEIAEGLGIVRYVYEHHGTVASVDARLVLFRASRALEP